MTNLKRPCMRETEAVVFDRGQHRPVIVTLFARHMELRLKGTRRRYQLGYAACFQAAMLAESERQRRAKREARQAPKRYAHTASGQARYFTIPED